MEMQDEIQIEKKKRLGQFFTPDSIAKFMASLFEYNTSMKVLDPGAGIGLLSRAVLNIALEKEIELELDAWEIDTSLIRELVKCTERLERLSAGKINCNVRNDDFIDGATLEIQLGKVDIYTHAILNPPYKKINSSSVHRKLLQKVGLEMVNLYTAFMAIALLQLKSNGEMVAIVPRSFCNGTYYLPFRKLLFSMASIKQIHLFKSRNKPFSKDNVLQENIILHLKKEKQCKNIIVSHSTDGAFEDYNQFEVNKEEVINTSGTGLFIHIPISEDNTVLPQCAKFNLSELNLQVSTGPVIDFRNEKYLTNNTDDTITPLIYPFNFIDGNFVWPREHKKSNGIVAEPENRNLFFPKGNYVLVKRFSSKEEKRRIVAYLLKESDYSSPNIGIENHLNVFHIKKHGLELILARGLTGYLNSSFVEQYFRLFSGHTQVNAGDLRTIKYPSLENLVVIGKCMAEENCTMAKLDLIIEELK